MLRRKLAKARFSLKTEKKKTSNAAIEVDDLKRQLSCLGKDNKKLIEESDKKEADLRDRKAKPKELEKSLDLEKVNIIIMFFYCH